MPWPAPGPPADAPMDWNRGAACAPEDAVPDGRRPCPRPRPRSRVSFFAPWFGSGRAKPTAVPGRQQRPDGAETDALDASSTYFTKDAILSVTAWERPFGLWSTFPLA